MATMNSRYKRAAVKAKEKLLNISGEKDLTDFGVLLAEINTETNKALDALEKKVVEATLVGANVADATVRAATGATLAGGDVADATVRSIKVFKNRAKAASKKLATSKKTYQASPAWKSFIASSKGREREKAEQKAFNTAQDTKNTAVRQERTKQAVVRSFNASIDSLVAATDAQVVGITKTIKAIKAKDIAGAKAALKETAKATVAQFSSFLAAVGKIDNVVKAFAPEAKSAVSKAAADVKYTSKKVINGVTRYFYD